MFQGPCVKFFVESRQAVAANSDTASSDAGPPGADETHDAESDREESRELAAASSLVIRVARDNTQDQDGAGTSVDRKRRGESKPSHSSNDGAVLWTDRARWRTREATIETSSHLSSLTAKAGLTTLLRRQRMLQLMAVSP